MSISSCAALYMESLHRMTLIATSLGSPSVFDSSTARKTFENTPLPRCAVIVYRPSNTSPMRAQ